MRITILVLISAILVGCPPEDNPLPKDSCNRVCLHYAELGCEEAKPTPKGATCVQVCENLRNSPLPGVDEHYLCVYNSKSCEAARQCE